MDIWSASHGFTAPSSSSGSGTEVKAAGSDGGGVSRAASAARACRTRAAPNQEDETEECSREPSLEDIIVTWELVAWEDAGHTEEDYEDLSHLFG